METRDKRFWALGYFCAVDLAKLWLENNMDFGTKIYRKQFVEDFVEGMYDECCAKEAKAVLLDEFLEKAIAWLNAFTEWDVNDCGSKIEGKADDFREAMKEDRL